MKIRAWTRAYRPFIMGGNVNAPIACKLECTAALSVVDGVYVHAVISPKGTPFFVESRSGGIVGSDLDAIRKDAETVSVDELLLQIEEQRQYGLTAAEVNESEFWGMMRELAPTN